MSYNASDLLEKFIDMKKDSYDLFMRIASNGETNEKFKVVARVLASEEKRHIELYKEIKKNIKNSENNHDISVDIYDNAAKLFMEFSKRRYDTDIESISELLQYARNFEKDSMAIALSVQGLLVREQNYTETKGYKILSRIINEQEKHIKNIEAFIK